MFLGTEMFENLKKAMYSQNHVYINTNLAFSSGTSDDLTGTLLGLSVF